MHLNETQWIGSGIIVSVTLLGGYLIALKIREHLIEKPDPKLTYATISEMEKLEGQLSGIQKEARGEMTELHKLIAKNAEQTAGLLAQSRLYNQRLTELGTKIDRLQLSLRNPS